MLTFVFHCIENNGSTSALAGKVSYTNSFVYMSTWDQVHEFLQSYWKSQ